MKTIVVGSLLGIAIGYLITLLMSAIFANGEFTLTPAFIKNYDSEILAFKSQTLMWAVVGIVFAVCNFIWSNDWSLRKRTLLTMFIYLTTLLCAAYIGKWIVFEGIQITMFILIFFAIFAAIWGVEYFLTKKDVEELNKRL